MRAVAVTAAVAVVLLVMLAGCGSSVTGGDADSAIDPNTAPERNVVTLNITGDAPSLPSGSSPLILRLSGCCANTEGELVYIAVDGPVSADVIPGKYYAKWVSPVTADGTLYTTPSEEKVIVIDDAHNEQRIAEGAASIESETDGRLVWTEMSIPELKSVNPGTARAITLAADTLSMLEEGMLSTNADIARDAYDVASKNLGYGGAQAQTETVNIEGKTDDGSAA